MTQPPSEKRICNICGTELQSESLEGLCPQCLLQIGFEGKSERHLHIRCPQCQIAIEIVADLLIREVTCPSCDSRFSLVGDSEATVAAGPARSIGRFELLDQVGIGAFGSVWKARDPELDRTVAVKIPRKEQLSADEAEQFLREARSAAQLKHPGIVSVHEVGREDDRIFIVSDFIQGVTLADRLSAGRPSIRESAELCRLIAAALQHAHKNGVIHRDLKPSNIMLDDDGLPHVMDFGLAKREAAEVTMTMEGRILGTPAYMSPEQARGDAHQADGRSDVYSLGSVLFELLTGEKPFRGTSQMLLHQVLLEEPPSPRKLNSNVPRDLETICLKCLEKEPDRRFPSAQDVADELRRFLDGQSIRSRPISPSQRGWRWCRRNPVVAGLTAAVALSLLIGLGTTFWQWRIAQRNVVDAIDSRELAVQSQQETQSALDESESRLARVYVERGLQKVDLDPHSGLSWLIMALNTEPEDSPEREMHRLRIGLMLRELPTLLGFWPEATDAKFSTDGTKVAIALANEVRLFELPEMRPVPVMHHARPVVSVNFSPQGDRLATVSREAGGPQWCRIWDTSTGAPVTAKLDLTEREYDLQETPTIHFTPDGERFVAVSAGIYNRWHTKMATRVFNSRTLEQVSPTFAHHSDLDYPAGYHRLSPDSLRVLVSRGVPADNPGVAWNDPSFPGDMGRPQQYDLMTAQPVHAPLEHVLDFYGLPVYSTDGLLIATSGGGVVKIWDAKDGTLVNEFPLSAKVKYANVQFHPDGTSLFAVESRKTHWWDIATGELKQEWTHDDKFLVDPTGRYRVWRDVNGAYYIDGTARQDAEEKQLPDLYSVRFCPDGSRFLLDPVGHDEAGLRVSPPRQIFRSTDAEPVAPPWRFSSGDVRQPFSQDGRHFLTRFDTGIWLWDLDRRESVVEKFPPGRSVNIIDAAISRDRRRCVVLSQDLTITCWDTESGEQLYEPFQIPLPSPTDTLSEWHSMTVNAAGDTVAIVGEYRAPIPENDRLDVRLVQVWDLKAGCLRFDPLVFDQEPNSWVTAARFLYDDQRLIVAQHLPQFKGETIDDPAAHDWTRLHLIDAATGTPIQVPCDFKYTFRILDFTADENRCLVYREYEPWLIVRKDADFPPMFVQMFDTKTWEPVTPRMVPVTGTAWNATLSPDGTRIVMGDAEVWDASSGERLSSALVAHRSVEEIVFQDDGQSFITVTDGGGNDWDPPSELRSFAIDGRSLCAPMTNVRTGIVYCAIHPHDHIVAVAGTGVRLWDAQQGSAISGVYNLHGTDSRGRVENENRSTFFVPSGNRLYIEAGDELLVVRWSKIVASLPRDDVLEAWTGILSGHRIDNAGGMIPMTAVEFEQACQKVQNVNTEMPND